MEQQNTIPKIIHYCWFGKSEIPETLQRYIMTWEEKLPDYQIIEWNEDNFDIKASNDYVQEAYAAKKYAFVSDYVRLKVLYQYGGIYLDTDIEMIQSPEKLLENASLVTGFETINNLITAFIACEKENPLIYEFLQQYESRHFQLEDGTYDLTPINDKFTELMVKHGLKTDNSRQSLGNGVEVYPYIVFCGQDIENSHVKMDSTTCTIHRFQSSWKKSSLLIKFKYLIVVKGLQKLLGYDRYDRLKQILHI